MSYRSNIQASRISRGAKWKNLWIPNYKRSYTKYFTNDYLTLRYLKTKFYSDDKLNWTFMYYYDFCLKKTFNQTYLYLKKYNIDFARLSQAAYIGWILTLQDTLTREFDTNFFISTMGGNNLVNFLFWPHSYYYNFLTWNYLDNFNTFSFLLKDESSFHEDEISILQTMSSSFFLSQFVFSTKSTFFEVDNFDEIDQFQYFFINRNISRYTNDKLTPSWVRQDRFWLANFLFNPTILSRYPNFVFFYNTWLHKSWQLSKREALKSLKLYQSSYIHATQPLYSMNYFFSKTVWFFFLIRELNAFFKNSDTSDVGLTQEFIKKQVKLLHLKLYAQNNMAFSIKQVWFYLKAYLKYFSYEGKININSTKFIFKKLFSFWKLLQTSASGIRLNTDAYIAFLWVYYFTIVNEKLFWLVLDFFFLYPFFFRIWFTFLTKSFLKATKLIWNILKKRNINIFLKFNLISLFTKHIIKSFSHILTENLFIFYPKKLPNTSNVRLKSFWFDFNALIIFFVSFFNLSFKKLKNKTFSLIFKSSSFFLNNLQFQFNSSNVKQLFNLYDKFMDLKKIIKYSDWSAIIFLGNNFFFNFLEFVNTWKILRRLRFAYFYFALSQLSPKLFFWIFIDLGNLTHFSMLVHLFSIYWQNFFFFYIFILKTLKKMYSHCSQENLLFITRPVSMFMQWSWSYITILDLFSSSFWEFLILGLLRLDRTFKSSNQKLAFTIADFADSISNFGKPNCWLNKTGNKFLLLNKFSYNELISTSPYYVPFFGIRFSSKAFFKKNSTFFFEKKNRIDISLPFFVNWVPAHLIIDHYSNLKLNATLIAVFIKKKLERDHLLAEILRSLNSLLNQAQMIKGFMFLLKGRFSRKEWASKIWIKKGKLDQVSIYTKLDYCKMPVTLKFGTASIWIWLVISTILDELKAMI